MAPHRLLICGHSIVRDAEKHVYENEVNGCTFNLDPNQIEVRYCGFGGIRSEHIIEGRVDPNNDPKHWVAGEIANQINNFCPSTVILQIGDNDLSTGSAQDIARMIVDTAVEIRTRFISVQKVGICKLLPRYDEACSIKRVVLGKGFVVEDYNEKANEINILIELFSADKRPNVFFINHSFRFPSDDPDARRYIQARFNFEYDGVHLTQSGHHKLY